MDGWYVTGVEGRGGNCDDIRLRCTDFARKRKDCLYNRYAHSEENSPRTTMVSNRFIDWAQCGGRHCDDKHYRQCTVNRFCFVRSDAKSFALQSPLSIV